MWYFLEDDSRFKAGDVMFGDATKGSGDTLRVLPPSGIFTPKDWSADLLLFAGGSGITPVMSIIRTALAQHSNRVVLFYANRDDKSVIFA